MIYKLSIGISLGSFGRVAVNKRYYFYVPKVGHLLPRQKSANSRPNDIPYSLKTAKLHPDSLPAC